MWAQSLLCSCLSGSGPCLGISWYEDEVAQILAVAHTVVRAGDLRELGVACGIQ